MVAMRVATFAQSNRMIADGSGVGAGPGVSANVTPRLSTKANWSPTKANLLPKANRLGAAFSVAAS